MARKLKNAVITLELREYLKKHPDVKKVADNIYTDFSVTLNYNDQYFLSAYVAAKILGLARTLYPDKFNDLPDLDFDNFPKPTVEDDIYYIEHMKPMAARMFENEEWEYFVNLATT